MIFYSILQLLQQLLLNHLETYVHLFHILPYMFKMFLFFNYIVRKKRNHLNHTQRRRGQHYLQLPKLNIQTTAKIMCMSVSCIRLDVK